MTNYEAIKAFKDLQDKDFVYRVGDPFPRDGKEVTDERVEELLGEDNKRKEAVIKAVEVEPEGDEGTPNEYPVHTGGGHYELSNGEKVQGKEKAIEAEKALEE